MNPKLIIVLLLALFLMQLCGCGKKSLAPNKNESSSTVHINQNDVYRFYYGEKDGFKVWIVDGAYIRRNILGEFNYGGNSQRYTFVPDSEIWIDNSISAEEFETALTHQMNVRKLMADLEMGYLSAQDSSLKLEEQLRKNYRDIVKRHEDSLPLVSPTGYDSTLGIPELPDTVRLKDIYRVPLGKRNGLNVWIVDGYTVRRDIFPDFAFSGNDAVYHFIPEKEIWIDGAISCEETEYSIAMEMKEREMIKKRMNIEDSFAQALKVSDKMRKDNAVLVSSHPEVRVTPPLIRDVGVDEE